MLKKQLLPFEAEGIGGKIGVLLCGGAILALGLQARAQTIFDLRRQMPDVVVQTPGSNTDLGRAFAAGDLNADGRADLIIGAPGRNEDGTFQDGAVYIFWGGRKLSGLIDFRARFPDAEIIGHAAGSGAGASILCADINDDRIDDLIVGAPAASSAGRTGAGLVEIFFGRKDFPGKIDLRSQAPDVLMPGEAIDDKFGQVLAAGDVNGDKIADLLIAAPGASTDNGVASGIVYLIWGRPEWRPTFSLRADAAGVIRLLGKAANNFTATALAVGNCNGDAFHDILIGAHKANFGQRVDCGETYLVLGKAAMPETLDLKEADRLFAGAAVRHFSGWAVGSTDVNRDQRDEMIIGIPGADNGSLRAAGQMHFFSLLGALADTVDLLQASGDFSISGPRAGNRLATSFFFTDFNNDGKLDALLGMPADASWSGLENAGALAVVYGLNDRTGNWDLQTHAPDWTLIGGEAGSTIGSAFIAADFDGDGKTDLAVKKNNGVAGNTVYLLSGTSLLTVVSGERKILNVPEAFALQANYPNPFSRATHLIFGAATPLTVDVTIYDVTGRHVRTLFSGAIPAGPTMLVWDGLNHAGQRMTAGLYFVRASAETAGQKMERTIKVNLLF